MANLQANVAAGKGASATFKYMGPGTGTYFLPIMMAFYGGYTPAEANDPANYNKSAVSSLFTNSTSVNALNALNPSPGGYVGFLYSDPLRRANGAARGYPDNFFITNPHLRGGANLYQNGGFSRYDSMQVELRRRMAQGLLVQANYVWAKAFGSTTLSTRRPRVQDLGGEPPHALKVNWVYELPIGMGRRLLSSSSGVVDKLFGGWNFQGVSRIQSAPLEDFGSRVLVGMTYDELKDVYKLRFDDANRRIYVLPDDFILNTRRANSFDATRPGGYSSSLGAPTGRYVAPAGCIQIVSGDCAPRHLYIRGTPFVRFDLSLTKQIRFTETKNFEMRGEFLNAFNHINFNFVTCASSSSSCGQVTSSQGDPRIVQIVLRLNF
jgi:hypothetical protein